MHFDPSPPWRACLAALLLGLAGAVRATDLTVEVRNVKSSEGRELVALFNAAEGFPRTGYWRGEDVAAAPPTVRVVFRGIPEGSYAVTAFQDLDNNRKLKTNGLGIPIEPLAFSNDPATMDGPPKFSDASFKVSGQAMNVVLKLK